MHHQYDTTNDKIGNEPCYYEVLGVEPGCNVEEIRRQYKILARRHHPDKQRNANPQGLDSIPDGLSHHHMFSLIARAYETLNDPTRRKMYDILQGHSGKTSDINELRQQDAERAVNLMKLTFDIKRRTELAKGGLVIDDAVYGATSEIDFQSMEATMQSKKVLNVTRQIQCAVEHSKLVLPAGEAKHYQIDGIFDPALGEEKALWVRYFFRGVLHQVIIRDDQRLLIPLKSHCRRHNGGVDKSVEAILSSPSTVKKTERSNLSALLRISGTVTVLSLVTWGAFHTKSVLSSIEQVSRYSPLDYQFSLPSIKTDWVYPWIHRMSQQVVMIGQRFYRANN